MGPYTGRSTDIGVVLDLMIHDLDLVLSLNPGPVEEVRAAGVAVLSSSIDIANARIQFRSGCVANLTSSRVSTNKMRRLRLFQRDNYVSIDFQTRQGMICRRNAKAGERSTIEVEQFQGGDEEPLKLQLASFLHAVARDTKPVVSGEDGAAAQGALDKPRRCLRLGKAEQARLTTRAKSAPMQRDYPVSKQVRRRLNLIAARDVAGPIDGLKPDAGEGRGLG